MYITVLLQTTYYIYKSTCTQLCKYKIIHAYIQCTCIQCMYIHVRVYIYSVHVCSIYMYICFNPLATTLKNGGNILIPCYPTVHQNQFIKPVIFIIVIFRVWYMICWNAFIHFQRMLVWEEYLCILYLLQLKALSLSLIYMLNGEYDFVQDKNLNNSWGKLEQASLQPGQQLGQA